MILDRADLFSHALAAEPGRLHFAAHSHHLWPDVTRAAHERAWLDAAELADEKWDRIFGEVWPTAQANVARTLGVADPTQVAFSANTHDLLVRLFSATNAWERGRPLRVISTGAEFHSFTRQMRRLAESGKVEWCVVDEEPFESLADRFSAAAAEGEWDIAFASHVLFSSGHVFDECFELLAGLPEDVVRVADGYHGFFAVPTDFGPYADRLYYTSGGYKYAMAGEGACFLVAPHGREERPEITGWFAGFGSLADPQDARVGYDGGAARFLGATFEPTPLHRFNAVCSMLAEQGLDVDALHRHSVALQERFLERIDAGDAGPLAVGELTPGRSELPGARRGNFLTFRRGDARDLQARLTAARVITDARIDRLRFGFGLYHRAEDVDGLVERLAELGPASD